VAQACLFCTCIRIGPDATGPKLSPENAATSPPEIESAVDEPAALDAHDRGYRRRVLLRRTTARCMARVAPPGAEIDASIYSIYDARETPNLGSNGHTRGSTGLKRRACSNSQTSRAHNRGVYLQ
jgi:hypothetical protein